MSAYTGLGTKVRVCPGNDVLGMDGKKILFQIADKDDSAAVDFNEFLQAVVGNLVRL